MKDIKWLRELAFAKAETGGEVTQRETAGMGALLFPGLRKIFLDVYKNTPEQYSKVFNVETSEKSEEKDQILGAMTPWNEFGTQPKTSEVTGSTAMTTVEYAKMKTDKQVRYIHKTFAKGFAIEQELIEDEQYGQIKKMPKMLAKAGMQRVELDSVTVFNNAFSDYKTTGSADKKGYDGVTLCNEKHPLGEDDTKFCSNVLWDNALTDAGLIKALELADQQVDEAGNPIAMNFDTLIVPPALYYQARKIVESAQVAGSNINDKNVLQGDFKVFKYTYLTNPNRWFLQASDEHQVNFFWRKKPTFKSETSIDTYVYKYNGRMRYSFGYSNFRGIIGCSSETKPTGA